MDKRAHKKLKNRKKRSIKKKHDRNRQLSIKSKINERKKDVALRANSKAIFKILKKDADPEFIDLVEKSISAIDFDDRNYFSEAESEIYKLHRISGWDYVQKHLGVQQKKINGPGMSKAEVVHFHLMTKVGQLIFDSIPPEKLKQFVPYTNIDVLPIKTGFGVFLRSLRKHVSDGRTFYYSPLKPTIEINGTKKTVAFSKHAIERTCERIAGNITNYLSVGEAFGYFYQLLYFEKCTIYPKSPGFTFYDECAQKFFSQNYVPNVLGDSDKEKKYYFRVGYCPVIIEGDFVMAKTLLYPGYHGTPEYGKLLNAKIESKLKEKMMLQASELTMTKLMETRDFSLIKWFHDQGIEQVHSFDHEIFADFDFLEN